MACGFSRKGDIKNFRRLLDIAKQNVGYGAIEKVLRPKSGPIPFLVACEAGKLEIVKEMLSFEEVDIITLRNETNENAFHIAARNKREHLVVYTLEECNISKDEIEELLYAKESKFGWKPLDVALHNEALGIAQIFWKREASHSLKEYGRLVQLIASKGGSLEFLREVLTSANRHYPRKMGRILNFECMSHAETPLTRASAKGYLDIVKLLLSFEETEIVDEFEDSDLAVHVTAFHAGASEGHLEIVKFLLETPQASRDEKVELLSLTNTSGYNAIDIARISYHTQIVKCFEDFLEG